MAVTILTIDATHFSINGITYLKNFLSIVPGGGDLVEILNVYDSKVILQKRTSYLDYTIDAVSYASAALLQADLVDVLFSRDTGGGGATLQEVTDNGATTDVFTVFTGGVGSSIGQNQLFGHQAGVANTTGGFITALGAFAAYQNVDGFSWTAVGNRSAAESLTGGEWVAVGERSARYLALFPTLATSFSNSVYVGFDTRVSANGVNNENVFGNEAVGKGSNTVAIGNSLITNNYFFGNVDAIGGYSVNGTEVIDASRNIDAGSGTFEDLLKPSGGGVVTNLAECNSLANTLMSLANPSQRISYGYLASDQGYIQAVSSTNTARTLNVNPFGGDVKFGADIDVTGVAVGGTTVIDASRNYDGGTGNFSGIVTAAGFVPFTGCHIAKSNEDLKLGELVTLNSYGKYVNEKQPDWLAEYCIADKKGNFGIVYKIKKMPAVKYSAAIEYIAPVEAQGVLIEVKEVLAQEEILAAEAYTQYLIAHVGDAGGTAGLQVTNENGNLECGDYLIPSDKKGFAKKSLSEFVPLNHCGKIGEDIIFAVNETERIGCAWIKE